MHDRASWDRRACEAIVARSVEILFDHSMNTSFSLLARLTVALAGHVHGSPLALLLVEEGVEVHCLVLVQGLEAVLVDGREMHEQLLTAVIGADETEPESIAFF